MRGALRSVVVLVALLGLLPVARAQEAVRDSPYYPLKLATTWHYTAGAQRVLVRVAKYETVGGTLCAVVETLIGGRVTSTEAIAARDDGVYRFAFNGQAIEPPLRFIALPPKPGVAWTVESKVAGQAIKGTFRPDEESVTVPAGTFQTIFTRMTDMTIDGTPSVAASAWYASGVGMVKNVIRSGLSEVVIELEKFEPGK